MNIREGMWVKLPPENRCGCDLCEDAVKSFHRVEEVRQDRGFMELGELGAFPLDRDWIVKRSYMENK